MAEIEADIQATGTQLIWVLEQDTNGDPGTAQRCRDFLDTYHDSKLGWCVGDNETQPDPGTFDHSPFSVGRGFDILVPLETMEIVYTTNHGTPSGNDNPTAEELLAEVERVAAEYGDR